jgi:ankyrin repeat protein
VFALRLFLKCGADVNAVDTFGQTALHIACYKGYVDCIYILVEAGASIEARDSEEASCLEYVEDETLLVYLQEFIAAYRLRESKSVEDLA